MLLQKEYWAFFGSRHSVAISGDRGKRLFGFTRFLHSQVFLRDPPLLLFLSPLLIFSSVLYLSLLVMEAKMGRFFDSIGAFFTGGDQLPWCDRDIILGCEREIAEAGNDVQDSVRKESIMRLSWALVHSRQPEDVQRGIAMLEASLGNAGSILDKREKLYLLAVGHYRSGDYARSRQLLDRCLEIAPDFRQAVTLKKTVEDRIAKDGVIGIGIAATATALVAGGLAAALARKK